MAVEYAGIFMNCLDNNKLVKLCDTLPFKKPSISFQESQLKNTIKSFLKNIEKDECCKKNLNFSHSYFVYHFNEVYFAFVARSELSDDKLIGFYQDLKKDLTQVCRGNLNNLQDMELNDGFYQRQLQPKLQARIDTYSSSIKFDKVKVAQHAIEEVKSKMTDNVIQMSENVAGVRDKLLPESQQLAMEARKFQKAAADLEKETQRRNFWTFSPKCVAIGAGTGGAGALLLWVIFHFIK